jgi:MFS transporter
MDSSLPFVNSVDKVGGSPRGRTTWLIYIVTGCFGYLLNGLGVVLQPLQESLGVSRDRVAFYPTLLAIGLVGVGLGGGRLVGAFGRTAAFRAALIALVCGAALLTLARAAVSLRGAVILGAAGALLIQLTPAALSALHPERAAVTVGEASACSSAASVIAPLAIAAGLTTGIGWRPGYLLPLVAAVPAVLALRALPEPAPVSNIGVDLGTDQFAQRWVDVLLAVSVEFCFVFWAASALAAWDGMGRGSAAVGASMFLLGMAAGRSVAAPAGRFAGTSRRLLVGGCLVAFAGFLMFWLAHVSYVAGAGLGVAGAGVALLYPAAVTRAIAACPGEQDRAAARCALASGLAIGGAPLILAQLADTTGLRAAYLIVPGLLAALFVHAWCAR